MSVQVRNVSYDYGPITALRNIVATAEPGQITAVLGPNASGKSTLLRCVVGAQTPASGSVMFGDTPVHDLPPPRLASHVAYVPQRSAVSAPFSVREVVELGRYALSRDPDRVTAALERMELLPLADRAYAALSVGQQQCVTLARALGQLAPGGRLVLDEPLSAMDLAHVRHTVAVLREAAAAGATVIIALHDLTLAAILADHVWLLKDAALVAEGSADAVMTPEQLERVFGVAFEYVQTRAGRVVLGQWS